MARQALGKGLSALIKKKNAASSSEQISITAPQKGERVLTISTAELKPSPFQPRRHFATEQIAELASSIKERGLIQPLVVRVVDGTYEIIAGERRLRAARSLGMKEIRAVIHEATDLEVAELTLIENLQRENLSPLEEAEQYKMLQKRFGLKQDTIAKHVGKSRTVIANMVRLLELNPEVRDLLSAGEITVGHSKVLLQLKNAEQQIKTATRVATRKLTVRQTEQIVRDILYPPVRTIKPVVELPENYAKACAHLSKDLGTKVNISIKGKNNGAIEIPYAGKEELTRIMQILGVSLQD